MKVALTRLRDELKVHPAELLRIVHIPVDSNAATR